MSSVRLGEEVQIAWIKYVIAQLRVAVVSGPHTPAQVTIPHGLAVNALMALEQAVAALQMNRTEDRQTEGDNAPE